MIGCRQSLAGILFAIRCGFRNKSITIRFRLLDQPEIRGAANWSLHKTRSVPLKNAFTCRRDRRFIMENTLTTEQKIRQAATKVFLEKGFDGTTTRDIAGEAGMNVALLNYYFRSKQKLFDSVFDEMLQLFFDGIKTVLDQPISLKDKVIALIDHDFRMFRESPALIIFVLNELHRNPDRFVPTIVGAEGQFMPHFQQQLKEAHQAGLVRSIDAVHLMSIISANTQFIFVNKNMHRKVWKQTDREFDAFALEHKKLVCDMIINYLFIT